MKLQQLFAKAQLDLLVIQCAIEGWDKDPDWVNRGKDGKFGGGGVTKATKDVAKGAKEVFNSTAKTLNVTKDLVKLSLSDSGFRERAGLSAGMGMAEIIKATSKAIGKTPELETKIDSLVQQAAEKLEKAYGGDKDPLAQAIRKSDRLEPPAGSSTTQKMEFAAAKYQLYMEALAQPEKYGYTPAQQQELVGKSIKASIPLVVDLAVNVGVGVAMGLLFRQSLSHALASAVLGEAVYRGIDKGLDAAGVDDPMVKTGIQLAVGLASNGVIELASKKIAGLVEKKAVAEGLKKAAAEIAKKEAAELAEKEAAEVEAWKKLADELIEVGRKKSAEKDLAELAKIADARFAKMAADDIESWKRTAAEYKDAATELAKAGRKEDAEYAERLATEFNKLAGIGLTEKEAAEVEAWKKLAIEMGKPEIREAAAKLIEKESAELAEKEAAEIAKKGVAVGRPLVTNLDTKVVSSNAYQKTKKVTTTSFNVNKNEVKMEIEASAKHGEAMVKDVEFKVGGTYFKEEIPLDESTVIMYQLKKIFKQEVKDSAEGTIFKCMAYDSDDAGKTRIFFYKLMGFRERNGEFFGIVKNGKLVPH